MTSGFLILYTNVDIRMRCKEYVNGTHMEENIEECESPRNECTVDIDAPDEACTNAILKYWANKDGSWNSNSENMHEGG